MQALSAITYLVLRERHNSQVIPRNGRNEGGSPLPDTQGCERR